MAFLLGLSMLLLLIIAIALPLTYAIEWFEGR